ncbi:MAG: ATP-binding protein [Alphaproteobacteria bacterium]|nr:ATP-binding protein [Alphaproteobacteria bacterium]
MMKVNKRFAAASFDNYTCSTGEQKRVVEALLSGCKNGFDRNIVILGGVGTGKTHLAYAIMNTIADRWQHSDTEYYRFDKVYYGTAKEMIDNIKLSWKDPEISNMDIYCKTPLLIIDEVGVQYGSDSERTELYEIFNTRYNDMLPTIVISNNTIEELQKILGQRIYDRLSGGALIFELNGRSHRQGG